MSEEKKPRRRPNQAEIDRLTQELCNAHAECEDLEASLELAREWQENNRLRALRAEDHPFRNLWNWLKG